MQHLNTARVAAADVDTASGEAAPLVSREKSVPGGQQVGRWFGGLGEEADGAGVAAAAPNGDAAAAEGATPGPRQGALRALGRTCGGGRLGFVSEEADATGVTAPDVNAATSETAALFSALAVLSVHHLNVSRVAAASSDVHAAAAERAPPGATFQVVAGGRGPLVGLGGWVVEQTDTARIAAPDAYVAASERTALGPGVDRLNGRLACSSSRRHPIIFSVDQQIDFARVVAANIDAAASKRTAFRTGV